ncbi:MAG: hypothetical protein UF228_08655 [Lachnospiraceae bacterium]|nr:hypothetical protein [Lachnospiraceae bacterium]
MDGAASSIHTRLNALVSQANDLAMYDDAIKSLNDQVKVYEKTGQRGRLGDIIKAIDAKERERDTIENNIKVQDEARDRIIEIDTLILGINKEIKEKKEYLEKISGNAKTVEASKKLLDDIEKQLAELEEKLAPFKHVLGEDIPTEEEITKAKDSQKELKSVLAKLTETTESLEKMKAEHSDVLSGYGEVLPTTSDIDELQSIYGELQGIISTKEGTDETTSVPEEYEIINSVVMSDDTFVERLEEILRSEDELNRLIRVKTEDEVKLKTAEESWGEKKKQYEEMSAEVASLKEEADKLSEYDRDKTRPVIEKLTEIQKKQQVIDIKSGELESDGLTLDELTLSEKFGDTIPDVKESEIVLQKVRSASRNKSEIEGLRAKLDGEKSKADGIKLSLEQYAGISEGSANPLPMPEKSKGGAMIGAGAAVAVIGAILGFAIALPILALALVGIVLIVMGVNNNKQYQTKLASYEASKETARRNSDNLQKKKDLESELASAQGRVRDIEQQIQDVESATKSDAELIDTWASKYLDGKKDVTEVDVTTVIDSARQVEGIAAKKKAYEDKKKFVESSKDEIITLRTEANTSYGIIADKSVEDALDILRSLENEYKEKKNQLDKAVERVEKFLSEAKLSEDDMGLEISPQAAELKEKLAENDEKINKLIDEANEVLSKINISIDVQNFAEQYDKAEKILNIYKSQADKQKEKGDRQQKKQTQIDELYNKLNDKKTVLSGKYDELELPAQLSKIREEIAQIKKLADKIAELESEQKKLTDKKDILEDSVYAFVSRYDVDSDNDDEIISIVSESASGYRDIVKQKDQLEKQKTPILEEINKNSNGAGSSEEEKQIRDEIASLEAKRDDFRDEYTHKGDLIRQVDQALEKYPDVVIEIRKLYEEKQKAQNAVDTLKRTIALITKAKENLANRYLSKVEDTFNNYMHIWLNNDAVRGILDIDFNVSIEENGKAHVAEGYSTGYCDLVDFCMRLALVDTLFETEQPFLIMDDPFVNLDTDRLDKALELLDIMAANKQIVYFVCHPIRAIEKEGDTSTREAFVMLAEATRQNISERKTNVISKKPVIKKLPKEMYKTIITKTPLAIEPLKKNYTITNSIFSLKFDVVDGFEGDVTYELFFIDAIGHVLNERQIVEIKDGKMSTDRVQFSLNTRDDSGDEYELMIRESGQDDYDVIARLPYQVKLAFAGTDSFGF